MLFWDEWVVTVICVTSRAVHFNGDITGDGSATRWDKNSQTVWFSLKNDTSFLYHLPSSPFYLSPPFRPIKSAHFFPALPKPTLLTHSQSNLGSQHRLPTTRTYPPFKKPQAGCLSSLPRRYHFLIQATLFYTLLLSMTQEHTHSHRQMYRDSLVLFATKLEQAWHKAIGTERSTLKYSHQNRSQCANYVHIQH